MPKIRYFTLHLRLNWQAQGRGTYHWWLFDLCLSTFRDVFDIKDNDVFWCTADVGWVTGQHLCGYGPLANGTTTVMFEGVPQYPDWARIGHIVDKHDVTILHTAPTAIRAMMKEGDDYVQIKPFQLTSVGSVGEPINPEAWNWYYNVVGEGRCPIVDTWWQTETGGFDDANPEYG